MEVFDKNSALWTYLPEEIKGLFLDGEQLLDHAEHHKGKTSDFSYLVFPFSKGYEGFLKRFFLDMGLIREDEYYSNDIRIGRILNPNFIKEKDNVFIKICRDNKTTPREGRKIAEDLWNIWRRGRNQVFHYFPHNFRRLTHEEALEIISQMVTSMENAVLGCKLNIETVNKSSNKKAISSLV